ncbi:putative NAD(P)H nitroreductase [Paenibacillus phyllosphaerae]|uniref:Putative NAD(P)H nitroreductase n=1 Tax=Paenibacillus phyllosphaerae TaxID=274593 RepID=A0A7W5FQL7_9BACL|nr:nitroreductase family protein [Paenibacillus phyllosphaerae]MBB3113590.1 putative NAD(P)H nitroreductase [Paenibacillus phyllosphaerae]
MSSLIDIVKERRSATKFKPDVTIPHEELQEIFSLVRYTPSAFNLQHAHYIVVQNEDLKNGPVYEATGKQFKVKTASAAILVLGDLEAYRQVGPINEGLLNLGVISKQEYDMTVDSVTQFYEQGGETFKRDEAIRNASLSAMQFMLIAKDKGWDTCPMIGFDAEAMRRALDIPDRYVPALLITIGQEDVSSQRPRGYRKPVGEFVTIK